MSKRKLMHKSVWFNLFFIFIVGQSCNPISPYKMELENNQLVCLKNNELFIAAVVNATVSNYEDYLQVEIEAHKEDDILYCSFIIQSDQQIVGNYFYENKSFNGVPYALNKVNFSIEDELQKSMFSTLNCTQPSGQIEITKFSAEEQVISGFINANLCESIESQSPVDMAISECRFYNVDFQAVKE